MNVVVTCEFRFFRTPDGKVWTSSAFQYQFWQRYLQSFDTVKVVARVKEVSSSEATWVLSSGPFVTFVPLPYYIGVVGLLKHSLTIRSLLQNVCNEDDAIIFRVPSQSVMLATLEPNTIANYAIEVVGDPYQVFNAGVTHSLLDKFMAKVSRWALRSLADSAAAACYVTNTYLQRLYPVDDMSGAISVGCSDIELYPDDFVDKPRSFNSPATNLVFVGSLSQLYKGPDTLLKALKELKSKNIYFTLNMLGGGVYLPEIQEMASALGLSDSVNFVGEVSQQEVKPYLDQADIFVMPSRTEGLPRALIEAMARGLPCLASNVGGIPELVQASCLFDAEDYMTFADKLGRLSQDTNALNAASARNLAVAHQYENDKLQQKRQDFYHRYKMTLLEKA